jgi:hypothetical protein
VKPRTVILFFALAKLALQLAAIQGYGYFRDEFYYLACADRLAAGYVDHPPLCVFILWAVRAVLGDSLFAIRLMPALAGAATVALVGIMARHLGGRTWALVLAMTAALVAPEFLALDHFYSMNAFDILFWALGAFLFLKVIERRTLGWWAALGVVLGLGLLNKVGVLWFGAGLFAGIVLTPLRRSLRSAGPWLTGAIAAAIFSPYVFWEVANSWPTREFIHNATSEKMQAVAPLDFLMGQVTSMHPLTLPLWAAGLVWLLARRDGRGTAALGWTYATVFAILIASTSSRSGYLAPAYTWLFAAGGVAFESWLARPRAAWLLPAFAALMLVGGAATAPLALPVLPIDRYIAYARALGQAPSTEEKHEMGQLGQFYADMHGWDSIVDTVAAACGRLSAGEASAARIIAPDYGVAGAIELLGRGRSLPPVISGHNNYWLWGPRGWNGKLAVIIGSSEERLQQRFESVELAGATNCGLCMPYENERPVFICRGLRAPVAQVWPLLKHYD